MLSKPKHSSAGETRHEKGGVVCGIQWNCQAATLCALDPRYFHVLKIEELRLYDRKSVVAAGSQLAGIG